jgi:hypothetical protein
MIISAALVWSARTGSAVQVSPSEPPAAATPTAVPGPAKTSHVQRPVLVFMVLVNPTPIAAPKTVGMVHVRIVFAVKDFASVVVQLDEVLGCECATLTRLSPSKEVEQRTHRDVAYGVCCFPRNTTGALHFLPAGKQRHWRGGGSIFRVLSTFADG